MKISAVITVLDFEHHTLANGVIFGDAQTMSNLTHWISSHPDYIVRMVQFDESSPLADIEHRII